MGNISIMVSTNWWRYDTEDETRKWEVLQIPELSSGFVADRSTPTAEGLFEIATNTRIHR